MELTYLLMLPITVVCCWILVFVQNGRTKKLHDRLILFFGGCCALTYYMTIHAIIEGTGDYYFILLDNIETVVGLSICPLLFCYIRSVAHDSHWHSWYWWLLSPAIVIGGAGTALSLMVGWDRIIEVRSGCYLPFIPDPESWSEILYYWINIKLFNITLELMAIGMLVMCIYYLVQYNKHAENYYANLEDSSIQKMHSFLFYSILSLITLFLLTFFVGSLTGENHWFLLIVSVLISVFLWLMAKNSHQIVVSEEHLEIINALAEDDVAEIRTVFDNRIEELLFQWQTSVDKPYCRDGITIADVAKDLEISPRLISNHIKKYSNMNFRRWINTLRINEAKSMIQNNPNDKITYIATLCGFADLPTFSKAFRLIEGCSPQEYRHTVILKI